MSDPVRPHRWQPTRLLRPWDSPGKNTGVGCHFLLQRMKVKSESEVAQSCLTLRDPMDCSLPGSSVHAMPNLFLENPLSQQALGSQESQLWVALRRGQAPASPTDYSGLCSDLSRPSRKGPIPRRGGCIRHQEQPLLVIRLPFKSRSDITWHLNFQGALRASQVLLLITAEPQGTGRSSESKHAKVSAGGSALSG